MRLYDTHCHFESNDTKEIVASLRRAKAAGVEKLMAVGGSRALNLSAQRAAVQSSEFRVQSSAELPEVVCALGYDRDQVGKFDTSALQLQLETTTLPLRALGEIGLDRVSIVAVLLLELLVLGLDREVDVGRGNVLDRLN